MCACVKAIENARAAALPSRYLLTSARAVSRSAAMPVANVTRTKAPGASRTRSRSAATGSSTAPGGARQRTPVERDRVGGAASAADELGAIGLPFDRSAEPSIDAEHVKGPDGTLVRAARPPAEQQAGVLRVVLGFDEQLPEGRMREVVLRTRQHDLGVAGDFDFARPIAVVGDRQPPDLDVVFRATRRSAAAFRSRRRAGGTSPCRARR